MADESWRDREAVLAAVQSWSAATGIPVVVVLGGAMLNVLHTGTDEAAEDLLRRAAASMAHGSAQRHGG